MWREDLYDSAGPRDAMQLVNKGKNVRNVLDHMTTDDLLKLVVSERIWKRSQIVNDVCMAQTICIDTNRAGKLILTTADIQNLFLRRAR